MTSKPSPSISPTASPSLNPQSSDPNPRTNQAVRFSTQSNPISSPSAESSHHLEAAAGDGHATESSGDEITPIAQRERGPSRGKSYDGTSTTAHQSETSPRGGSGGGSAGSRRRRKTSGRRSTGGENDDTNGYDDEEEEDEGNRSRGVTVWLKGVAEKYGSVELDNKGSVARDHLALERTFLAWLRTSLAFASIGIAITQLFRLNTTISEREGLHPSPSPTQPFHLAQVGKPLGATFLGIAILVLILGGRRYFESQYWIVRGKFPASRGSVLLVTGVAVGVIVGSLVVVCVVEPGVFERR